MSRILALLLAFVFCTYATHARADVRLTDAQMDEVTAGIMVITNGPQLSAMVPSVYFSTALMRNNWDVKLTLANNGFPYLQPSFNLPPFYLLPPNPAQFSKAGYTDSRYGYSTHFSRWAGKDGVIRLH